MLALGQATSNVTYKHSKNEDLEKFFNASIYVVYAKFTLFFFFKAER